MLTQLQKEKLLPLTLHSKFGKLLIDAIAVWETAIPYQGGYGITRWYLSEWSAAELTHYEFDNYDKKCCLIGASLVNKTPDEDMSGAIKRHFNVSYYDMQALIRGFDEESIQSFDDEVYKFGKQVAEILFHENE